ncbi:YkgJ family cysteine cluster protein [Alkalispirochaeta sphaeroplastigenens]|nr:YkgJ family cysteine cluster protein [Alkalispirochaeta sphaeroplastigenens]
MEKRFFCTQCGICCRYEEGYVFLSPQDLEQLTAFLGQKEARIVEEYCRWVPLGGEDQLSLREQPNHDCVFWRDGGCIVYEARPLQCRTYPLWRHILEEPRGWEQEALSCPGIGIGEKVSFLAEKRALRERQRQGPITRPRSGPGRK